MEMQGNPLLPIAYSGQGITLPKEKGKSCVPILLRKTEASRTTGTFSDIQRSGKTGA